MRRQRVEPSAEPVEPSALVIETRVERKAADASRTMRPRAVVSGHRVLAVTTLAGALIACGSSVEIGGPGHGGGAAAEGMAGSGGAELTPAEVCEQMCAPISDSACSVTMIKGCVEQCNTIALTADACPAEVDAVLACLAEKVPCSKKAVDCTAQMEAWHACSGEYCGDSIGGGISTSVFVESTCLGIVELSYSCTSSPPYADWACNCTRYGQPAGSCEGSGCCYDE